MARGSAKCHFGGSCGSPCLVCGNGIDFPQVTNLSEKMGAEYFRVLQHNQPKVSFARALSNDRFDPSTAGKRREQLNPPPSHLFGFCFRSGSGSIRKRELTITRPTNVLKRVSLRTCNKSMLALRGMGSVDRCAAHTSTTVSVHASCGLRRCSRRSKDRTALFTQARNSKRHDLAAFQVPRWFQAHANARRRPG